jgi:hypothetical protein
MSARIRSRFMIALQVIAACSLLPLLGLPAAELPQTTNRMAGRHFVFNVDSNDYDYAATPGRAQAWMRAQYRRIVSAGADVLIADVALPDVVETKDTPTGEIIGARLGSKRYKTVAELSAQCTDTLRIACDEGHRRGALVLAGMRMSDAHHGTEWKPASDSELFGKFTMEHPEWCNTWPDGRKDATLNYAFPEVRAHRLAILRERAMNYDIDGIELNWMRWCRHFPAGKQRQYLPVKGTGELQWIHRGFEQFSNGLFDNGGDNLYVNARGIIEMIHRFDVNNDGYVDIVLPNCHGYIERGPTWIYTQATGKGKDWPRREFPNDSGWMSRIVDVDGDGHPDLIVVNGENGITSELNSYVYWGGPVGLTNDRTELPTAGAYDVAAVDLKGNGRKDLIFPSAWVDHHNPGEPRPIQVYEQVAPRKFVDASRRYGLTGVAAVSIACEDLNGDGRPDLVVANLRKEFETETDSFVYWGTEKGFNAASPLRLPTHCALQAALGDLNGDGRREIVFAGGNRIYIYWNRNGVFHPEDRTILEAEGYSTMFCQGAVRVEIADVDGDGRSELLVATKEGIEIRAQDKLQKAKQFLPLKYSDWVEAVDLDGDNRLDLLASRYENGKTYEAESAIFWNGPAGFSRDRVTWLPTCGAVGCTAGKLDGSGRPAIVFNNTLRGPSQFDPDFPLYIYLGSKDHNYSVDRRLELPTGGGTNTYAVADLDLDGYPELVMTSPEGLRVFRSGPEGLRPDRYTILRNRGQMSFYVLVADFNHDGWLDLLDVGYTYDAKSETMANSSVIFWGSSSGFSSQRSTVVPTFCAGNARLADVNKDGWIDILFWDKRGYLAIYLGGPKGYSPERMLKVPMDVGTRVVSSINCADLNEDGWLDLVIPVMGHYTRRASGFFILYGGPDGFSRDRIEFHPTKASPSDMISVADLNRDGHLDLMVPAYSTQFSRELPAHIFWGNGKTFDFDRPFVIPADSSTGFMAIDITGDGYLDLLTVCHRNDVGHKVDSLLFWNGPKGLSLDNVTRLPGLGPHLASPRDFGNAYTRKPLECYISPAYDANGLKPVRLTWKSDTPGKTHVKFQLRWAESEDGLGSATWNGPKGAGTFYESPGEEIRGVERPCKWLQYKAVLVSLNGCRSPKLDEVQVDFLPFDRELQGRQSQK